MRSKSTVHRIRVHQRKTKTGHRLRIRHCDPFELICLINSVINNEINCHQTTSELLMKIKNMCTSKNLVFIFSAMKLRRDCKRFRKECMTPANFPSSS
jgi:hypothetical protein